MSVEVDARVRPAVQTDQRQIGSLIQHSQHIHRHLDWRNPLDWIGSRPYFVLENQEQIVAALACPPDPPQVAWIRLFANSGKIPFEQAWQILWEAARSDLASKGKYLAGGIVLNRWMQDLLCASGFQTHQSIVMLEREDHNPIEMAQLPGISIRQMLTYDLPAVAEVDAQAFDLLWQNSLPALERAYPQATLASVAEMDGRVVGYQISTRNSLGAHLARLAVRPEMQGRSVGRAMVADLVRQAEKRGMFRLTVNTQSDNATSLALYKRTGFRETGEQYPVYQLQVQ
jgi:ribosomal-protein-alanine N-acetyltransferase